MASNGLGAIAISLGLDAAEFTQGMTKAEYESKKSSERIAANIDNGVKLATAALASLAVAGTGALIALGQQADKIAVYKDLGDQIGDAAEQVASLKLAADLSGTAMDTIAASSIKLTSALSKTDDESKGAGAALSALALDMDSFKELTPVQQLDDIARSLSEFEDGAGKTAVAVALFGKSGAALIPFLNDLAEGGERNIALTAEQIQQADDYTKAQARLKSEFESFVQVQASLVIPTLSEVQKIFADLAKDEAAVALVTDTLNLTIKSAIVVFQTFAIIASDLSFIIRGLNKDIETANKQRLAMENGDFKAFYSIGESAKKELKVARDELDVLQKKIMSIGGNDGSLNVAGMVDQFLPEADGKKKLQFSIATPQKSVVSEAQKYLENLQKQLQGAKDLSAAETVLADIQSGRLKLSNGITQEQVLGIAKQIDQQKALKVELDRVKKANEDINKSAADYAEIVAANNAVTQFEVSLLGKSNEERQVALQQFKIQLELEKKIRDIRSKRGSEDETNKAIESVTGSAGSARANVSAQAFLDEQQRITDEAKKVWDNFSENVQRNIGDGLYNAMRGNFDNIGDAFLSMIQRMLADAMAANLVKALMGGSGSGGGGMLGGLLSMGLGLITGGAGPSNPSAGANGFVDWSPSNPALAGMSSFDVGTPFVPQDMVAKIHKGERILTASENRNFKSGGGSSPISFAPVYQIDSRSDRAAIMQDMDRISRQSNAELVDKLQRAGKI